MSAETKPLSEREREVVRLTANGDDPPAIGRALGISHRTARWHLQNAKKKLKARNLPHLIAKAISTGDLPVPTVTQ